MVEGSRRFAPGANPRPACPRSVGRGGRATSEGDAAFDASLRAQDARLGYKDLGWVMEQLGAAGLGIQVVPMPANNLMLIAFKI